MSTIERQVMANVTLIYAARIAKSATALKVYVLLLSVVGLTTLVSISNVALNFVNVAQGGVGSVLGFVVSALLGTTIVVQLTLAIAAASTVLLVAPVLRGSRVFA